MANEVRRNSSNSDRRFSNFALIKLFNDSQKVIRSLIHTADGTGKFFPKSVSIPLESGKMFYDLPDDCYTINSINDVEIRTDASSFLTTGQLRQVLPSERSVAYGYYPFRRQIRLTFSPSVGGRLIINYVVKLPSFSPRCLEVKGYSDGKIRAKINSWDKEVDLLDFGDMISIVNRKGEILFSNIEILSYNQEAGSLILGENAPANESLGGGEFVALGADASTHQQLPEEVHHLLTTMVERRVKAIDADLDFKTINFITDEERMYVTELFGDSGNQARHTPLEDDNYLTY